MTCKCYTTNPVAPIRDGDNYYCATCRMGMGHAYFAAANERDRLAARLAEVQRLLDEGVDIVMRSAPQSWAAGTSLYDHACAWERDADAWQRRARRGFRSLRFVRRRASRVGRT